MSPRFSGGSRNPIPDPDEGNPEFAYGEPEETITVKVRATLLLNMWVESTQTLKSVQVLVTDSRTDEEGETLIGVDGVTGTPITVKIVRP